MDTAEFVIEPAAGGAVRVRIPEHDAAEFRRVLVRLVEALERGLAGKGRLAWAAGTDPLFPPAYGDRRRSREYRMEHAAQRRQRLLAAAERVDRQLATGLQFTLDPAAVADWFIVCGHAQSLFVTERWGARPLKRTFSRNGLVWLMSVQQAVAGAAMQPFADVATPSQYPDS